MIQIHPESAKLFQVDAEAEKAKQVAFRLLSGRAYTRKEILGKLQDREFSKQAMDQTVADLERLGLIDDRAFAEKFVESRLRNRPQGRFMMARDLKRRGIPAEVIDSVLEAAYAELDAAEMALKLMQSRKNRYRGLERQKALSRMFGFLGRRGFDASVTRQVIEQVWREMGEDVENASDEFA
ncbi:MAG: regulatory protein RecX [bacterium]|nr:regulatory protein RecX [bacterium]